MITRISIFVLILSFNAYAMLNPVKDVNFQCIFPINISTMVELGSSGNSGADKLDSKRTKSVGVICECPLVPPLVRIGVPFGMNTPSHTLETTTQPFNFPSLGISKPSQIHKAGGSDASTGHGAKKSFVHSHLNRFNVLQILDIFQDTLCMKDSGADFDILYMSEVDVTANSSSTATYLFPETVLFQNPVLPMSCAADATATMAGATIDSMYWCVGGHSVFPMSNWTPEATSFEDSSSVTMVKMMYRMNRMSLGKNFPVTAGAAAIKSCYITFAAPMVIKSQYRIQPAIPIRGGCERLGTPPIKWNTPQRSTTTGNMVEVLWTRQDCCAL